MLHGHFWAFMDTAAQLKISLSILALFSENLNGVGK